MKCPACGHEADYEGEPSHEVIRCSECSARIAYGVVQPRVVVQPAQDPRFVQLVFDGVVHELDRQLAHLVGLNVLSICPPPQ